MRVPTEKELNIQSRGIDTIEQRHVLADMATTADNRGDYRFAAVMRALYWTACVRDSLRKGNKTQAWRDRESVRRNLRFARYMS